MLTKTLVALAAHTKVAVAATAGAALLAGGGAVAVTQVAHATRTTSTTTMTTAAGTTTTRTTTTIKTKVHLDRSASTRPAEAADVADGDRDKAASHTVDMKPTTPKGACVSQRVHAAQTLVSPGAKRGEAVSTAAHSCDLDGEAEPVKPVKPVEPVHSKHLAKVHVAEAAEPTRPTRPTRPVHPAHPAHPAQAGASGNAHPEAGPRR